MSQLFCRDDSSIRRHIINIFNDGELKSDNNVHFLHVKGVKKTVPFYSLDVIISVGYRVHSYQGILFRQWATGVLKDYLLRGYVVHQQISLLEERFDRKLLNQHDEIVEIKKTQDLQQKQLDFFIATNTMPSEMIFFEGDLYKSRVALENLVKTADRRIVVIDGYINALTLDILDARSADVEAIIYTSGVGDAMRRLMAEHDRLFPKEHIDIRKWRNASHDRWLVIDNRLYHCGHSLNANGGQKISAITLMGADPEFVLREIEDYR